jgi:carotenoid cleavage dioxygenase
MESRNAVLCRSPSSTRCKAVRRKGIYHSISRPPTYTYFDLQWFRYKNCFPSHTANAYEDESGNLIFDLGLSEKNVFFWWPDAEGNAPEPSSILSQLVRFTINPRSNDLDIPAPTLIQKDNSDFYRIDDRFATQRYRHCFCNLMDPALGTDFAAIEPRLGGGYPLYNALARVDVTTGSTEVYFPGKTHMVQEPVFIPREGSTTEGDGYVLFLVNNYDTMSSELHLVDTKDFSKAKAVVLLPVRLRHGLHGSWVDARDMAQ